MGILKNDVGRPSNKTIMIRKIIGVVAGIIVIGLIVGICFLLSNPNTKNSGEHKTKVTNQKQEEQPSNIKKCDVKKTSVEGDSEIAVVKNKMSYWTVGGYPYFENKELDSKTIPTYAKISTALYSLGYFESDAVNKINEDGCYIDKKEIDEELANIYSDIKYDPTEFLGNDCLPYKFSYDSKNERFTVINSAAGGCGDASGVIEKKYDKKENSFKVKILYVYPGELGNLDSNNEIKTFETNFEYDYSKPETLIDKYDSYANIFEWKFVKNSNGKYVFDKIERIK